VSKSPRGQRPPSKTVSDYFNLGLTQGGLDFADVQVDSDTPLYLDAFALGAQKGPTFGRWHEQVQSFFATLVQSIRSGNGLRATELMEHLKEPNETRLGLSIGKPRGTGADGKYAERILVALRESTAVQTGLISSLEETELMVDGISHDRISDLATNVLREQLVAYTQDQCALHHIAMEDVNAGWVFRPELQEWEVLDTRLPVTDIDAPKPLLLIPKRILRRQPSYDARHFYRQEVLSFLRGQEIDAMSGLVRVVKRTGEQTVSKKDLEEKYPFNKEYLAAFSKNHPEVLHRYRQSLTESESQRIAGDELEDQWLALASYFLAELARLQPGSAHATTYHRLIAGILEFVLYPTLWNPRLEVEIHDGRKRIDIVMENNARFGVFATLPNQGGLVSVQVPIECKNYSTDPGNPELDQLIGRFSASRGRIGVLICRSFDDRPRFIQRCHDTLIDGHGLVIPLCDDDIVQFLESVIAVRRDEITDRFRRIVAEIYG
jgi:hypothetical protein